MTNERYYRCCSGFILIFCEQNYAFYVHQTTSTRIHVRRSVGPSHVKTTQHTYCHCPIDPRFLSYPFWAAGPEGDAFTQRRNFSFSSVHPPLEAQPAMRLESQPRRQNSSSEAQIPASWLNQPGGLNPSHKAKIPALRLKFQH